MPLLCARAGIATFVLCHFNGVSFDWSARVRVLSSRQSVAGKWPVSFLSQALIHYTITFAVLCPLVVITSWWRKCTHSVSVSQWYMPCVKAPATSGTLHEAASCWSNYEHFE